MYRGHILIAFMLLAVISPGCKKDNSFDAEFAKAAKVIAERGTPSGTRGTRETTRKCIYCGPAQLPSTGQRYVQTTPT